MTHSHDVDTDPTATTFDSAPLIAQELGVGLRGVLAVVQLLAEGATVPFIARYRKELTGNLDEVQIRTIQERHTYLTELESTRVQVLKSIESQGKLTEDLRNKITRCATKAELDDLYLPYKPKRRTRAMIARERGLEPLADLILSQALEGQPEAAAQSFIAPEKDVPDVAAALAGARDIVAETVSEHAEIRSLLREAFVTSGVVRTAKSTKAGDERTKFEDYYDYSEPVAKIPSHRFLAIRRGETEGVLRVELDVDSAPLFPRIERLMKLDPRSPFANELRTACEDAYKRLLVPSVTTDVRVDLKLRADREAIDVFADNLRNLLLAAPLGPKNVIGIDPGLRTGCKVVAVDSTGKYIDAVVIYPGQGDAKTAAAQRDLTAFVRKHKPLAIAVGNGTGGRETEKFAREIVRAEKLDGIIVVSVSEAGASVYSASDIAREEFPNLDLTIRGAISIARRLQDPLAELVKIEPKSIGVGQYQHDVFQPLLTRKLGEVVESCVNNVGVELNTASSALLSYVSGVGPTLAKRIVAHREESGPFESRQQLLKVSSLGPKAFLLAAGFLRVRGGAHPLDASAVHPESYPVVERMAADLGVPLEELIGNVTLVEKIDVRRYLTTEIGESTLADILLELKKPGRDPRASFEAPSFRDDVNSIGDLTEGMILEGVVTNVTAFGAFVDIGVHQDGLVHVSQLADRFVKDPREVVKVGDRLNVRVLEVDLARHRIALSARSGEAPRPGSKPGAVPRETNASGGGAPQGQGRGGNDRASQGRSGGRQKPDHQFRNNPFAGLTLKK